MADLPVGALLVAGLTSVGSRGKEWYEEWLRENTYPGDIDQLETEFVNAVQTAVARVAREEDNTELLGVIQSGEDLAPQLDDIEVLFGDVEGTVEEIADAIVELFDLSENSREDVVRVASLAYDGMLREFADNIAGTDLRETFEVELGTTLAAEIDELREEVSEIAERSAPREQFDLFASAEVDDLISEIQPPAAVEFVPRPEFDAIPDADRLLVLGPAGSGKTRVLEELLRRRVGDVAHLMHPSSGFAETQDRYAFEYQSFDGDVLLVWDDIHRITEERENEVFESVINRLEETLDDQGHDLHVLAAARSGNLVDLPGKGVDSAEGVKRRDYGLWGPFEPFELKLLPEDRLRDIAERMADDHDVTFEDDALEDLVEKATHETGPNYLYAVVFSQEEGSTLTETAVEALPDEAVDVWHDQYGILKEDDPNALWVLRACRILYDLDVPYVGGLVRGVYEEVLSAGGKGQFFEGVTALDDRRWLSAVGGGSMADDGTRYRLHDTQAEATEDEFSLDPFFEEVSTFVLEGLDRYLSDVDGTDFVQGLSNFRLGDRARDRDRPDRATTHYERSLEFDDEVPPVHNNYALLLKNAEAVRDVQAAKAHYEAALELTSPSGELLDSTSSEVHNNYALLLSDAEAVRDVQAAKAHYEAALELTSPSGKLLDSTYSNGHYNYATLLAEMDHWSRTLHHFTRYLRLSDPGIHVPTAIEALLDTLEEPTATVETVSVFYRLSLACTVESELFFGLLSAGEAWDRRTDLSAEDGAYPTALAAGVWYAVHCSLAGRDDAEEVAETVQEAVEPHLDRLSPTARALHTSGSPTRRPRRRHNSASG